MRGLNYVEFKGGALFSPVPRKSKPQSLAQPVTVLAIVDVFPKEDKLDSGPGERAFISKCHTKLGAQRSTCNPTSIILDVVMLMCAN